RARTPAAPCARAGRAACRATTPEPERYLMPAVDFIEMFDGALDRATCQGWIDRFEAGGQARRGQTGSGVDVSMKDSWDIQLERTPGWADVSLGLNQAVLPFFK